MATAQPLLNYGRLKTAIKHVCACTRQGKCPRKHTWA